MIGEITMLRTVFYDWTFSTYMNMEEIKEGGILDKEKGPIPFKRHDVMMQSRREGRFLLYHVHVTRRH
jgi:hypothetical protein